MEDTTQRFQKTARQGRRLVERICSEARSFELELDVFVRPLQRNGDSNCAVTAKLQRRLFVALNIIRAVGRLHGVSEKIIELSTDSLRRKAHKALLLLPADGRFCGVHENF